MKEGNEQFYLCIPGLIPETFRNSGKCDYWGIPKLISDHIRCVTWASSVRELVILRIK